MGRSSYMVTLKSEKLKSKVTIWVEAGSTGVARRKVKRIMADKWKILDIGQPVGKSITEDLLGR